MSEMIDRVLTSRRLCAWMDFSFILIRSKRKKKGKSAARQGTKPGIPEVMGPRRAQSAKNRNDDAEREGSTK